MPRHAKLSIAAAFFLFKADGGNAPKHGRMGEMERQAEAKGRNRRKVDDDDGELLKLNHRELLEMAHDRQQEKKPIPARRPGGNKNVATHHGGEATGRPTMRGTSSKFQKSVGPLALDRLGERRRDFCTIRCFFMA